MAATSAAALARIQRSGMGVIQPAAGLAALQRLLSAAAPDSAQVQTSLAIKLAWPLKHAQKWASGGRSTLLVGICNQPLSY